MTAETLRSRGASRRSFSAGLRNPNPLVLVAASFLLVLVLFGIDSAFASGAWSAVPLQRWIRNSNDDYMFVSWTVADLKFDPPTQPTVVLVGGSSGREALTSGPSLAASVEGAGGPQIGAWNLCTRMQRFGQSWAIVDNVPDTPTTVVIGVNADRFTTSAKSSWEQVRGIPLLIKSDSLRSLAIAQTGAYKRSYTILPGVFIAGVSYAEQRAKDLVLHGQMQSPAYTPHPFEKRATLPPAVKQQLIQKWFNDYYPAFLKMLDFNAGLLDELVSRCQARGLDVVIVELPNNRDIIGSAYDNVDAMYQPRTQEIATNHNVPYLDFNDQLDLSNEDFLDLSHLRASGRVVWEARLAEELAALYKSGAIEGGTQ